MTKRLHRVLALLGVVALVVPAAAVASHSHGKSGSTKSQKAKGKSKSKKKVGTRSHGSGKAKYRTYVFKGVAAQDGTATDLVVNVTGGNSRGKEYKGQSLTFALDSDQFKKIKVADRPDDADTVADGADVRQGDELVIQVKLRRGVSPASLTEWPARIVTDKTNPPVEA